MKALVTHSEGGAIYDWVKALDWVEEGASIGGHSMAWEKGRAMAMARRWERTRRRSRWLGWAREEGEGGSAWWASSPCWATQGQMDGWLLGRLGRKLKEKSFQNKNWILNILGLWKFIQWDLWGILIWGFFLSSSRLLKDDRKILYLISCNAIVMQLT
jgi:hypothetical protein